MNRKKIKYVKKYYNAISQHLINITTPVMAGVRTTTLSSLLVVFWLILMILLGSIFSSDMAIGRYVAQRAGIGINAGKDRGINSSIRGGEVQHTGVVLPFLKNLKQRLSVVHKMVYEVGQRLYTFLFGDKR